MKKILTFSLIVCFFITTFNILVFCSEKNDSLNLTEEEKSVYPSEEYTLIKIYSSRLHLTRFGTGYTVEEIVNMDAESVGFSSWKDYMLRLDIDGNDYIWYNKEDENLYNIMIDSGGTDDWGDFYKYALHPERVLGISTKVNQVYCFGDDSNMEGISIYYETNKGDYILWKEYGYAKDMYLMPLEEFVDFSEAYVKSLEPYRDIELMLDGGPPDFNEIYDLSQYEVKDYSGILFFSIVVIFGLCVFVVIFMLRKKA